MTKYILKSSETIAFITLFILFGFSNCQYPVDNSTLPEAKQFVVIDAELTETYGKINVTYSLQDVNPLGGYSFTKLPKTVAYVLNSRGTRYDFPKTDGTQNIAFNGVVGETYRLFVEVDGKKYESKPEKMPASPELDSVVAPYHREVFRSSSDLFYDGFDVYANFKDPAGQENYYQMDWVHYERATFCDQKITKFDGIEVKIPCFPTSCWNIIYNTRTIVLSDKLRDGKPIEHRVVRVPYALPPSRYYLSVTQRAITPSTYAYLQSIETQTQNSGTLFDVPAQTRFSTNIYNVSNPSEQILGIFNVFSFRKKIIHIDMSQQIIGATPKVFTDNTPFTADIFANAPCTEGLFRTKIKPEAWVD
jgi:hypothetical protein